MRAGPVAVIGAKGQVSRALVRAAKQRDVPLVAAGRPQADIGDFASLSAFFAAEKPALVINAAAYTAVDKAESDAAAAQRINQDGPGYLATLCAVASIPLIHISTDYVFDGRKPTAYVEDDVRAPLSVYGLTKSAGEDAIRQILSQHIIVRTAWVYGLDGQNFLKTMLKLGAERDVLRVVVDQHGTPTSADHLASALLDVAAAVLAAGDTAAWGTYHLVPGGQTSWHGFAAEIFRQFSAAGGKTPGLEAITTAEYPVPAVRPQCCVLDARKIRDTFGIVLPPWQQGVAECVRRYGNQTLEDVS